MYDYACFAELATRCVAGGIFPQLLTGTVVLRQDHRKYHKKDLKAEFSYFKTPSVRLWQVRHLIHTPTAMTSS